MRLQTCVRLFPFMVPHLPLAWRQRFHQQATPPFACKTANLVASCAECLRRAACFLPCVYPCAGAPAVIPTGRLLAGERWSRVMQATLQLAALPKRVAVAERRCARRARFALCVFLFIKHFGKHIPPPRRKYPPALSIRRSPVGLGVTAHTAHCTPAHLHLPLPFPFALPACSACMHAAHTSCLPTHPTPTAAVSYGRRAGRCALLLLSRLSLASLGTVILHRAAATVPCLPAGATRCA